MAETKDETDVWDGLGLPPEPAPLATVEHTAEVVDEREEAQKGLRRLEDGIFERSMVVIDGVLHFAEIDDPYENIDPNLPPDVEQKLAIPQTWIDELGLEGATRRYRMAKAAYRATKDAPVGIRVASQVMTGIVKARATERSQRVALNVGVINMSAPLPQFETRKVLPKE